MSNYLLIIDTHQVTPETRRSIDAVVKQHNASWWHFIQNIWVVHDPDGSSYDSLRESVKSEVQKDDGWFLLITLNQANLIEGVLPKEAWTWLRDKLEERPLALPPRMLNTV